MSIRKLMSCDFDLVLGAWQPKYATSLLARSEAGWAVEGWGVPARYGVLSRDELLRQLTASSATDVGGALLLDAGAATIEADAPVPAASRQPTVVVDEHGAIGILTGAEPVAGGLKSITRSRRGKAPLPGLLGPAVRDDGPVPVTRELEAGLPASAAVGQEASLLVSLTGAGGGGGGLPTALPVGTQVVVVVQPSAGLTLVGPDQLKLEVTEPQSDLPVRFDLRSEHVGPAHVKVHAFHGSASLGRIVLHTTITDKVATPTRARVVEQGTIQLVPRAPPDLSLHVFGEGGAITFWLESADGRFTMNRFGPSTLRRTPEQHFRAVFDGIERLSGETPQKRRAACRQLEMRGADLFQQVFPSELKTLLWDLRDRIRTIQILSDEAWIPWELCHVSGSSSDPGSDGFFLAERFCVTRWLAGAPAATRISLRDIALVAPDDTGLSSAAEERRFLLSLAGKERSVTALRPTFLDVTDAMARGRHDAWHFVGHASAADGSSTGEPSIALCGDDELVPANVSGRYAQKMRVTRPFVFLNACQTGRGHLSLTGLDGWARRFVGVGSEGTTAFGVEGASAFVGSYWSVFDEAATAFSKRLYEFLLGGAPIGAAVRDARAAVRKLDELTWLAYTVYADPNATVTS